MPILNFLPLASSPFPEEASEEADFAEAEEEADSVFPLPDAEFASAPVLFEDESPHPIMEMPIAPAQISANTRL